MKTFYLRLAASVLSLLGCAVFANPVVAKVFQVDCTKKAVLQEVIDQANDGDTIEITGICSENIVIRDMGLALIGAAAGGPHGISGNAAGTDGVRIENSRGTRLENLTITNPHFTCVRIRFHSEVQMSDSNVSGCFGGAATGIWAQDGSEFTGTRLQLDDNLRGLGAAWQSRAWCSECDLNDNANWAASAWNGSQLSLLDSVVTGSNGLDARQDSYIDIDCLSHASAHGCSMSVSHRAAFAANGGTAVLYESGVFEGRIEAVERGEVQLWGARQQVVPTGDNHIDGGSWLRVGPGDTGNSQLIDHTEISAFSHALIYGPGSTVLNGTLNCSAGGDAWIEPGVDLTNFVVSGCTNVP